MNAHCSCLFFVATLVTASTDARIHAQVTMNADPCANTSYAYIDMHYGRRSTEWFNTGQNICDDKLPSRNWTRFDHPAGNRLPEYAVTTNKCGTMAPIWLNGSHPHDDNVVTRQACATIPDNFCSWSTLVSIKLCRETKQGSVNEFYVYQLTTPPGCAYAYCVDENSRVNCSSGMVWNSQELKCKSNVTTTLPPGVTKPTTEPPPSCESLVTTAGPAPPGTWSEWCGWTVCSKACDYGSRTRRRECLSLPCTGPGSETELCAEQNCPLDPNESSVGLIVLFAAKDGTPDVMLAVVVDQQWFLEVWQENINVICNADPSSCCGKQITGFEPIQKIEFVSEYDIRTASGYPRPSGVSNVQLKYIASINVDIDALVCGRTHAQKSHDPTYINQDILKRAVQESVSKIEFESGVTVAGYETPFVAPPDDGCTALCIGLIVTSVIVVVAIVVSVTIFFCYRDSQRNKTSRVGSTEAVGAPPPYEEATSTYETIDNDNISSTPQSSGNKRGIPV